MYQPICRDGPTVLLIVFLIGVFAGTPTPSTAASGRDAQEMAILQRMAGFLSQAQRFSVTAEMGFDVVQESGEKLEFGETRQFLIRRPDRARIDITKRDGTTSGFIFDGQTIAVFNTREQVYATAAKPGTLDEAISYFINDLDMRFPLAEIFSTQLAETLLAKMRIAHNVGQERIMGVPCEHLALRGEQADVQLWVAQGDRPLPCRLVITYRAAEGQPQFWAQFGDWNLSPDVPDERFAFTPPEGATKIAFGARKPAPTAQGNQKGKKGSRP
jgi:hypothetical protein